MKIFVSYRRSDSRNAAARLVDRLVPVEGIEKVFFDIESIKAGENFADRIVEALQKSEVCLVLIGEDWVAKDDNNKSRLEKADDFVRMEVLAALQSSVSVIPVLLDNTLMPNPKALPKELRALTSLNAAYLRHETFKQDVNALTDMLLGQEQLMPQRKANRLRKVVESICGFAVAAIVLVMLAMVHRATVGGALEQSIGPLLTKLVVVVSLAMGALFPFFRRKKLAKRS